MSVKYSNKSKNSDAGVKSQKFKKEEKLNSFKKKKLKNMQIDVQNQILIKEIETLLSTKKEWTEKSVEKLFSIMYYHFDVATIYGFQIEKGILEFVDNANSFKCVQLCALCMSRFSNIKKSNGALLLQKVLKTFLEIGKQYFDFFDISSNLVELTYDFTVPLINFSELEINNNSIMILMNRINFLIYVIHYIFDIKNELSLTVAFEDLAKIFIAFLSITPKELLFKKTQENSILTSIPYIINSNFWKILNDLCLSSHFNNCEFEFIPKLCNIIKLCLTENLIENNSIHYLYISNILIFLSNIVGKGGVYYLSSVSCLIQLIVLNIKMIVISACTNNQENIITLYLQVLNKFLSNRDKNVEICITSARQSIFHIKKCLDYLQNKLIYCSNDFKVEYDLFLELIKTCITSKFSQPELLCEYFKTNDLISQTSTFNSEISIKSDEIKIVENDIDKTIELNVDNFNNEIESYEKSQNNLLDFTNEEFLAQNFKSNNQVEEFCELANGMKVDSEETDVQFDSNKLQIDSKIIDLEEMLKSFVPI